MARPVDIEKRLVGRRIVRVANRTFDDGRGGIAHDPEIVLDDGTRLTFSVEETETGEYGVSVNCLLPIRREKRP